jgi:serine/threonine protein kinase
LHENQSLSSDAILAAYLVEDIRSGGMGNVYIAEHKQWKLKLAIKAPNEKSPSDKGLFNRVLEEAEAWIDLGLHNG